MKKIIGIGNALVDVMTKLENDELLNSLGLPKGSMQLVDDMFTEMLGPHIEPLSKSISAGGSAANTINGLANLGLETGFIGVVGHDDMGRYFAEDMIKNKIQPFLFKSINKSGVATAFVSPDSERTFATYLGAALELDPSHLQDEILKQYNIIHIEGYLVQNYALIEKIMQKAHENGLKISLDLASFNVVEDNREFLTMLVKNYVDIVFANEEEAKAYTGKEPEEALNELADQCEIAVVKIGAKGSRIKTAGQTYFVNAITANPIDTTGAGDLYASGFLYGFVNGYAPDKCGLIAAILAGNVIEVLGSKMDAQRWEKLIAQLLTL